MSTISAYGQPNFSIPIAGDMSASFRSAWIWIATNPKPISLEVSWPATGGPHGAFTLETCNNPADTSGAPLPATALAAWTSAQPSGSAGSAFVDNISTAGSYVALVYTQSSGGTGAVPTATLGF